MAERLRSNQVVLLPLGYTRCFLFMFKIDVLISFISIAYSGISLLLLFLGSISFLLVQYMYTCTPLLTVLIFVCTGLPRVGTRLLHDVVRLQ